MSSTKLQLIKILVLSIALSTFQSLRAQGRNEFFPDCQFINPDGTKTYFQSFKTINEIEPLYWLLEEEFQIPELIDNTYFYKINKKEWDESDITIKVEVAVQTDLDNTHAYLVSIYVKNKFEKDLLDPTTQSYRLISRYFSDLFEKFIKISKPDLFEFMKD